MVPLFGPIPGGPELFIIALVVLIPLGVSAWIYSDATKRDISYAPAWALGIAALFFAGFFPGLLALAAYFYVRAQMAGAGGSL
ncbi:hypothetical protein [Halogranum rubrum]|uniref:Cardiolipin synthase N-terminal domain-containing protein n=1 Tax=Halogranum salarium B-1 TaxID=1210908 RepID=J3JHH0_9EURY|nr:hypothetical protein [Halogranum salarium]EJN60989.1 hypothetical protein HSB1_00300 [Halogranum salarium B-1]